MVRGPHQRTGSLRPMGDDALVCEARSEQISGSTVLIDVDNKTLFHAFLRGKARDSRMHEVITKLFWLQIDSDFTLRLRWVKSEDNAEADDLSRPDAGE